MRLCCPSRESAFPASYYLWNKPISMAPASLISSWTAPLLALRSSSPVTSLSPVGLTSVPATSQVLVQHDCTSEISAWGDLLNQSTETSLSLGSPSPPFNQCGHTEASQGLCVERYTAFYTHNIIMGTYIWNKVNTMVNYFYDGYNYGCFLLHFQSLLGFWLRTLVKLIAVINLMWYLSLWLLWCNPRDI